jgi:hypothetical protein
MLGLQSAGLREMEGPTIGSFPHKMHTMAKGAALQNHLDKLAVDWTTATTDIQQQNAKFYRTLFFIAW